MTKGNNEDFKREFFAAANSGNGFVSFYSQVFDGRKLKRRYLIKGGPGTGKSTFMRTLAQRAEENGLFVEYYRCSSDPSSLDAIIIEGRVAVLDATSPHCVDADIAGARDNIINLGDFWDSDALFEELNDIRILSSEKKEHYSKAYRFLSAAMQVDEVSRELIRPYIDAEKMRKAVKRTIKKIPDGSGFEMGVKLRDSIGMTGRFCLDIYEKLSNVLYVVRDSYKSGSVFLGMLVDEAIKKGNRISVSYYPISPTYLDAVFFEEVGIGFVLEHSGFDSVKDAMYINMKRFIKEGDNKGQLKEEYKSNIRLFDGLVLSAKNALESAGNCHFKLEKLYKKHMDFKAQDDFVKSFSDKLIEDIKASTC